MKRRTLVSICAAGLAAGLVGFPAGGAQETESAGDGPRYANATDLSCRSRTTTGSGPSSAPAWT